MFINPQKVVSSLVISPGMIVSDFGVGSGGFLTELSKQVGTTGKVYAVDVQAEVLKKTQDNFLDLGINNVEFIHGNLEKLGGSKIADNSLDLVLLANIFFQVDDNNMVAQEAFRVVKNKGRIVVIDWKDSFAGIGPSPDLIFNLEKALETFSEINVEIDSKLNSIGNYHYGIIFRKK